MIYWLIFFILLFFSIFEILAKVDKKYQRIFRVIVYVFMLYLIFFSGTRESTGYDFESYKLIYFKIQKGLALRIEPLFVKLFGLGKEYRYSLLLVSFFSVGLKVLSIIKYSPLIFLSLLIYYSTYFLSDDMGRIRIGLASAICIYFYNYIVDKKIKRYFFVTIIAFLIHRSSIIYMFLPLFYKLEKKFFKRIFMIIIFIPFFNTGILINQILLKIPYIKETISMYGKQIDRIGLNLTTIFYMIFTFILLYHYEYLDEKFEYFKIVFCSFFLGTTIYLAANSFRIIATRGSETLMVNIFLVFPYLLKIKSKKLKILYFILIMCYIIVYLLRLVNNFDYLNYNSWLFY